MDSLTEDLWASIFVRLPLKTIATSKLVCKQWKSMLESPCLRNLFPSHHQNSHSMWSLMVKEYHREPVPHYYGCELWDQNSHPMSSLVVKDHHQEAIAHYGCEIWGHPPQQLGSYISTFITEAFLKHTEKYRRARVVAYTDVGLILIRVESVHGNVSLYVANPVSRECVETDPPWCEAEECFWHLGLATRADENGVRYKVVLLYGAAQWKKSFDLLIYSSETGLWRQETVQFPHSCRGQEFSYSISLNGNIHWVARNEVVVSIDFYDDVVSDHPICRVTRFPDLETSPQFQRSCTVSQGSLMYMNIVSQGKESKLSVWRLESTWEWQLVSDISYDNDGYRNIIPLAINPFDAETVYFWNDNDKCLVSMDLRIGKFVHHGELERSDGCLLKTTQSLQTFTQLAKECSSFVLPKWLYRIPTTVVTNSSNPTFIWWPKGHSNPWQNIKQKKSAKGNSSSSISTAHHIARRNRFSMLED